MNNKWIVIIISILLLFLVSCKKVEEEKVYNEVINIDNDKAIDKDIEDKIVKEEKVKIVDIQRPSIDNSENITKILVGSSREVGLPFYNTKWIDNDKFIFQHNSNMRQSSYYTFNTEGNTLEKQFDLTGEFWWKHTANAGKGLIYSEDGLNGLYYLSKDENVKIMDSQEGYSISPDGRKIIISGIPAGSNETEVKRYIYDIEKKSLEATTIIPSLDYVFSYVAVRWSPDSSHISSQNNDESHTLNIIDVIENRIKKEITRKDAIISQPSWSPDGSKLVFMVQSKKNNNFYIDGEEMEFYMSDVIGIYDTEDNTASYIDLGNNLTISTIVWDANGKDLYFPTVSIETARKILKDTSIEIPTEGYIDENYSVNYLDINAKEYMKVFESNIHQYSYSMIKEIQPISLYNGDTLIYLCENYEKRMLKAYSLKTQEDVVMLDFNDYAYLQQAYKKDNSIVFVFEKGVFYIKEDLKLNTVINFEKYKCHDLLYVYSCISPNFDKAIIGVEYFQNPTKDNFLEIIDLDW